MATDVTGRVARGVALLDEKVPGWVDRVDVEQLDVSNGLTCVLGQLFLTYSSGRAKLDLDEVQAAEHGFQLRFPKGSTLADLVTVLAAAFGDEYPALTREWQRVIGVLKQNTATEVTLETKELVHA